MHVFIDSNVFLNFFHYSKDELDALNKVFASHEHGSAEVYLTEQVKNEFSRNREGKIKDALKTFNALSFNPKIPSFMKGYEEYEQLKKMSHDLQKKHASISSKVQRDIADSSLLADRLIGDILEKNKPAEISEEIYKQASIRSSLGNPPGKGGSIGDAVNWELLLKSVPSREDLHIISADGDFYSALDTERVHPFLASEWQQKKHAKLFAYRTLSLFIDQHFDGVAFSFDKNKEALIEALHESSSFASSHSIIARLEEHSYFSQKEVIRILEAAVTNQQFGAIVTDHDVSDFLNRVAIPHMANLASQEHKRILEKIVEEQNERLETDA